MPALKVTEKKAKRLPKTLKEKRFVKALPTAKDATEAAMIAGYKDPGQAAYENKKKLDLELVLSKAGITIDTLAVGISEGLQANKVISARLVMQKKNDGQYEMKEANGMTNDFIEVEDYPTRLSYIKEAGEWFGLKTKEADGGTVVNNYFQYIENQKNGYGV